MTTNTGAPSSVEETKNLIAGLREAIVLTDLVVLRSSPGSGAVYASRVALGDGAVELDAQHLGNPADATRFDKALSEVVGPCIISGLHGADKSSDLMALERAVEHAAQGKKTVLIIPHSMSVEGQFLGKATVIQHDISLLPVELSKALSEHREKKKSETKREPNLMELYKKEFKVAPFNTRGLKK